MRDPAGPALRRNFRIDLFGAACAGALLAVLGAFMPVVVRRMGGSTTEVALVVAAPMLAHLLAPVLVHLLSGLPVVRVVAGATTLSRLVFGIGVLLATGPLMLAATTLAFWIVTVAGVGAYATVIAGIYPEGERGQAVSRVRSGAALASIAAAAAAGLLIDTIPATVVFAAAAAVSLPGAVGLFGIRFEGDGVRARAGVLDSAREVWADRSFRGFQIAYGVFGSGNLMSFAVYPILLVDQYNVPATFVGIMAAAQAATTIATLAIWGRRIGTGPTVADVRRSAAMFALVPIAYVLSPTLWGLLPTAVFIGIGSAGLELAATTLIVRMAPPGRVAAYAATNAFMFGVRGTLAPFVASALMAVMAPRAVLIVGLALILLGLRALGAAAREPLRALEVAPTT